MTDTVRVPRAWLEAFRRDTDPTEPIADDGGTVWDMFCHEATAMLAASPQGEGSSADADTHRAAEGAVLATDLPRVNDLIYTHGDDAGWVRICEALPRDRLSGFGTLHPSTADLVDRFARAIKEKLEKAEVKYGYSDGWLAEGWRENLVRDLAHHVQKGDPRDVAAYCAFAWHHGWSTAASPQGEGSPADWITHDGGPNPVPGKMVDAELGCGVFVNCLSDLLTMFWPKGGRYRVTEGVKP